MNPSLILAELVMGLDPEAPVPRETIEALIELAKAAIAALKAK